MTAPKLYHGGAPGLVVGDLIEPRPNGRHVEGCQVCEARANGEVLAIDGDVIDPPTQHEDRVYVTEDRWYARFYASLAMGDLYRVEPVGPLDRSTEDPCSTAWRCPSAKVTHVVERAVRLTDAERRRTWRRMGGTTREFEALARQVRGGLLSTAVQR